MLSKIAVVTVLLGILSVSTFAFVESQRSRDDAERTVKNIEREENIVSSHVAKIEKVAQDEGAELDFLLSQEETREENLRQLNHEKFLLVKDLVAKNDLLKRLFYELEILHARVRAREERESQASYASELREFSGCSHGLSFVAHATAYSSTYNQTDGDPFTTATGTQVHWGTIAVDPNVIPYGCRVTISGFPGTVFTAEDTGGAIYGEGNRIDIWFSTTQAALEFGVQNVTVTIQ